MELELNGRRVHYETAGQGPDILLLHGWGSSLDAYRGVTAAFSGQYRLTSLDFPGFGASDLPPEPWSVDDYASFTLDFIQALGLNDPILVGHSFGGRVAIKLAGTGRLRPPKIVLIDSAGIKPKKSLRSRVRLAAFKTAKGFLTLPLWRGRTAGLLDRVRAHFGSADYNSAPPVMRQTLVRVVNEDLSGLLPSIQAPTLLIWGENDAATPLSDAKRMEALIPDAGLCVIRGAGHFSFVERPAEVHRILASFFGS